MRVLNLYAGIGGNRKLWQDVEVTAVEYDPEIAKVYQDFFPNDTVIVADAHEFLLKNFRDYDFIWSSPPCPSHSDIRRCGVHAGQYDVIYPEMSLYQEIILLQHFVKIDTKWVIENVRPYYQSLITPTAILERHYFWSNFYIPKIWLKDERRHEDIRGKSVVYGFDLQNYKVNNKRKLLRNMVNPELGNYILNEARQLHPEVEPLFLELSESTDQLENNKEGELK